MGLTPFATRQGTGPLTEGNGEYIAPSDPRPGPRSVEVSGGSTTHPFHRRKEDREGTQRPPGSEPGQPLSSSWLGRGPENPGAPTREPVLALTEGAATRKPTIPALSEGAPTQEPVSAMKGRAPTPEPVEIGIVMDK